MWSPQRINLLFETVVATSVPVFEKRTFPLMRSELIRLELEMEERLSLELGRNFPEYTLVFEDSPIVNGESLDLEVIIDPIDGTKNCYYSVPMCILSCAVRSKGSLVAGLLYGYFDERTYISIDGEGAFVDGQKVNVPLNSDHPKELSKGLLFVSKALAAEEHSCYDGLFRSAGSFRHTGCPSLDVVLVAFGAVGCFDVHLQPAVRFLDVAAAFHFVSTLGILIDLFGLEIAELNPHQQINYIVARDSGALKQLSDFASLLRCE